MIGAVWCPSCLVMKPILKRVQEKIDFPLNLTFYDIDEDPDKMESLGIKESDNLPITIIKSKGKEVDRFSGEMNEKKIINKLKEYQ